MNGITKTMFALATVFTVASASAQPAREGVSSEERAKQISERMAEKLQLNDTQKEQIYDLYVEFAADQQARPARGERPERAERPTPEEMEAMKEARTAAMEARKEKMEEMDAKIREILSAEQYEKWKESMERGPRPQGGPRMQDRGRGPHPGHAAPGADNNDGRRERRGNRNAGQESGQSDCNCGSKQ